MLIEAGALFSCLGFRAFAAALEHSREVQGGLGCSAGFSLLRAQSRGGADYVIWSWPAALRAGAEVGTALFGWFVFLCSRPAYTLHNPIQIAASRSAHLFHQLFGQHEGIEAQHMDFVICLRKRNLGTYT